MIEQIYLALISLLCFPLVWLVWRLGIGGKLGTILTNFGILLFTLCWLWIPFTSQPRMKGLLSDILRVVGISMFIFGVALGTKATLPLLRSTGSDQSNPSELLTKGVYGLARHPIYTGCIVGYIGWALAWKAFYALLLTPIGGVALWLQALAEEKYMLEPRFEDKYRNYRKMTPRFFPLHLKIVLGILIIVILISIVMGWTPLI